MGRGEWKVESGKWKVESGEWGVGLFAILVILPFVPIFSVIPIFFCHPEIPSCPSRNFVLSSRTQRGISKNWRDGSCYASFEKKRRWGEISLCVRNDKEGRMMDKWGGG